MQVIKTKDNTRIIDSYQIKLKKSMREEINWIKEERKTCGYPVTRTTNSYVREWKGHNNLYNLHLFRSHTKDVDLCENIPLWEEIVWFILGGI